MDVGWNSSCPGERDSNWVWLFLWQGRPRCWKWGAAIQIRPKRSLPSCLFDSSAECLQKRLWVLSRGQTKARPALRVWSASLSRVPGEVLGPERGYWAVQTQVGVLAAGPGTENCTMLAGWLESSVLRNVLMILLLSETRETKPGEMERLSSEQQALRVYAGLYEQENCLSSFPGSVSRNWVLTFLMSAELILHSEKERMHIRQTPHRCGIKAGIALTRKCSSGPGPEGQHRERAFDASQIQVGSQPGHWTALWMRSSCLNLTKSLLPPLWKTADAHWSQSSWPSGGGQPVTAADRAVSLVQAAGMAKDAHHIYSRLQSTWR